MESQVAEDMHPAEEDMHRVAEEMRPAEEDTRPAAGTPEEPGGYLSAAAMPAEALRPAARGFERPSDFRRPRRMRRSAHSPRRIVDKRHCSSRVSLKLLLRTQITDCNARVTTEQMGCGRTAGAPIQIP
jgi:hypothetical protein